MGKSESGSSPQSIPPALGAEAIETVLALASDGDGIVRTADGRVVFVEGAVPGDRVVLGAITRRRKVFRARIDRLVEASPDRVEPVCRYFGLCGGCTWQHVRYSTQLAAKQQNLRSALERIGGLRFEGEIGIVASPDPLHYRARARLVEAEGGAGYRRRGSNESLRIEECSVLVPAAQTALAALGRAIEAEQSASRTAARTAVRASARGRAGAAGRVAAGEREWTISAGGAGAAHIFEHAAGRSPRVRVVADAAGENDPAPEELTFEVLGERLRIGGPGFMQGNALLWESFAGAVRERCLAPAGSRSPRRFVELYAGIGFLTLPLARAGLEGVAVESDRQAAADLAFNLERAGLAATVRAIAARVEGERPLADWLVGADLLLVDPPRVGLDAPVRAAIAVHGPPVLVYVSCDPATLARDLAGLVASGYRIVSAVAIDLFPQTPHVEAIVRLER